jgi:hypothetical protein
MPTFCSRSLLVFHINLKMKIYCFPVKTNWLDGAKETQNICNKVETKTLYITLYVIYISFTLGAKATNIRIVGE